MAKTDPSAKPKSGVAPLAFGALAGVCLTAIVALGATTFWSVYAHPSEKVSPGVKVADVDVGGMPRQDVGQVVRARIDRYAGAPITISLPGGMRRVTAAEL